MGNSNTTGAIIIVTVDHTGYTGTVTIGAVTTPPDALGMSQNIQYTGVAHGEGIGYQTELSLLPGQSYILYAFAESSTQNIGGSAYFTMPSEEVTIHLTIYGQPVFIP